MIAKCIKTFSLESNRSWTTFDKDISYECIRSIMGGTVIVKAEGSSIKLSSSTFDTHFTSIEEIRNDKLDSLLNLKYE